MYRVQMVTSGIPAYQNDVESYTEALRIAASLASGAKATLIPWAEDVVRYQNKTTFVRVFEL